MAKSDLKHYKDAAGHVFSLTEADAKLLGYTPVDFADVKKQQAATDEAARDEQAARGAPRSSRG